MENRKRVLVVEDDETLLRQYVTSIKDLGIEVDGASTRDEAMACVDRKTYHLALIDVMLTLQRNDRGGLDVMEQIRQLDEGTEMIALSGADEVDVPVEALQKYGAKRYILKHKIKSFQEVLEPIQETLATAPRLKTYGRYRSLIDYLAIGHDTETFWVDKALRLLKPMEGWSGLNAFVSLFFGRYAPLLPKLDTKLLSEFNETEGLLIINLWSKAVGEEVILFARSALGDKDAPAPKPDRKAQLVQEYTKAFVNGWAYLVEEGVRAEFVHSIDTV